MGLNNNENRQELPEEVKELIAKGEKIDVYNSTNVTIYAKRPSKSVVKYFTDQLRDQSADFMQTQENIFNMLVVYPKDEELKKILEDYPAICFSVSDSIMKGAGFINFTRKGLSDTES